MLYLEVIVIKKKAPAKIFYYELFLIRYVIINQISGPIFVLLNKNHDSFRSNNIMFST